MRSALVSLLAIAIAIAAAAANLRGDGGKTCQLDVRLLGESGEPIPGVVRFQGADGKTLKIPELVSRGVGLGEELPIQDWYALPAPATVTVPRGAVTVTALSGLETETASLKIDATGKSARAQVTLKTFWDRRKQGLVSANTHLHVMKLSREDCDRYLADVPKADDLDVLFLSYLERADADRTYISNRYNGDDLSRLTATSGVVFGNGEEHRHNFGAFGAATGTSCCLTLKSWSSRSALARGS